MRIFRITGACPRHHPRQEPGPGQEPTDNAPEPSTVAFEQQLLSSGMFQRSLDWALSNGTDLKPLARQSAPYATGNLKTDAPPDSCHISVEWRPLMNVGLR